MKIPSVGVSLCCFLLVLVDSGSGSNEPLALETPNQVSSVKFDHAPHEMQLVIKYLNGTEFTIGGLNPDDTIASLKSKIQEHEGIPPDRQRLIYAGEQLEDPRALEDYNLKSGDIIHLVLRLD